MVNRNAKILVVDDDASEREGLAELLRVWGYEAEIVNLTGALGAVNLAGPRAREAPAAVTEDTTVPMMVWGSRVIAVAAG